MSTSEPPAEPATAPAPHAAAHAFKNALKLAGSLVVSFGITLLVRHLLIPRTLGAERFGELSYADGLSALFLVGAWLGVDVWLRTELGNTLKRADGIFGGVLLVRFGLGGLLTVALAIALWAFGRSNEIILTACIFAVSQIMVMSQSTASAVLHSAGRVDGLSVVNVVTKLMWAAGIVPALVLDLSIVWLAFSYTLSETFRFIGTMWLCRKHAGLTFAVDWAETKRAIRASLSWWVNAIALAGMGRADVAVLGAVATAQLGSQAAANKEVGWYTAVLGFGGIIMAVVPVITWVLLPPLSRAAKQSAEQAAPIIRRALEACVVVGAPVAVGAHVAAEQIVLLLKPEFLPAANVLEIMAVTYLVTYVNVVAACCLAALNRGWTVTIVSLAMLGVAPLIDYFLVPVMLTRIGPSGGSIACAIGVVVAEVLTTAAMLRSLGKLAYDARLISCCVRTVATAAIVIGADFALRHTGLPGWPRVGIAAVLWVVVALATRAVHLADVKQVIQLARAQRAAKAAGTETPV